MTIQANGESSGLEDKEGRHPAADLRGSSMPYVQGDVRLGGLSSSNRNERWDYSRHDEDADGDHFYASNDNAVTETTQYVRLMIAGSVDTANIKRLVLSVN